MDSEGVYNFPINIFIEKRGQSCVWETVSLSYTTSFAKPEGVYLVFGIHAYLFLGRVSGTNICRFSFLFLHS
jgi:hypothetical protein